MLSHLNISEDDILAINDNINVPLTNIRTTSSYISKKSKSKSKSIPIIQDTYQDITNIPFNLSTMTICGRFGGSVNILNILELCPIIPYWKLTEGCLRVEGYKEDVWSYRGICRKYIEKPDKGQGPFKNSVTLYYRIFDEETGDAKEPSIKLFKNGGFQSTGIRTPFQAEYIVKSIKNMFETMGNNTFIPDESTSSFISVSMMNSDITIPYTIRREALQQILKDINMRSSFESTTYQGVNIKYYWNYEKYFKGLPQTGKCECTIKCISSGKKRMMSDPLLDTHGCVRITIAPFQTGKIIITGAKRIEQVNDASKWILNLIQENSTKVLSDFVKRKVYPKKSTPFRGSSIITLPEEIERYILPFPATLKDSHVEDGDVDGDDNDMEDTDDMGLEVIDEIDEDVE